MWYSVDRGREIKQIRGFSGLPTAASRYNLAEASCLLKVVAVLEGLSGFGRVKRLRVQGIGVFGLMIRSPPQMDS